MVAGDIMVRDVITAKASETLDEVLQRFASHHIGGMPVIDDEGRLIGIITDGDIMYRLRREQSVYLDGLVAALVWHDEGVLEERAATLARVPVIKAMTKQVIAITPDTELRDVAAVLSEKKIKKVPVIDNRNSRKLVGIISRGDIIRVVVHLIHGEGIPQNGQGEHSALSLKPN